MMLRSAVSCFLVYQIFSNSPNLLDFLMSCGSGSCILLDFRPRTAAESQGLWEKVLQHATWITLLGLADGGTRVINSTKGSVSLMSNSSIALHVVVGMAFIPYIKFWILRVQRPWSVLCCDSIRGVWTRLSYRFTHPLLATEGAWYPHRPKHKSLPTCRAKPYKKQTEPCQNHTRNRKASGQKETLRNP